MKVAINFANPFGGYSKSTRGLPLVEPLYVVPEILEEFLSMLTIVGNIKDLPDGNPNEVRVSHQPQGG